MTLLTLQELLSRIQACLAGTAEFSVVRRFVFQFYEAEQDFELDKDLRGVFPILLPYLHHEESEGDPKRNLRLRRFLHVLKNEQDSIKERVVFALEFEGICKLTKKVTAGVIPGRVYDEQITKLSPCEFDCDLIKNWGKQHVNEDEPRLEKLR